MGACARTPKDENELAVARSLRLSKGRAVIINRLEQHLLAIFKDIKSGPCKNSPQDGLVLIIKGAQHQEGQNVNCCSQRH